MTEAVVESMTDFLGHPSSDLDPRTLLTDARTAMAAAFDESVHGLLQERFTAVDHLEHLAPLPQEVAPGRATDLEGRTPDQLVDDLLAAAGDCSAVAAGLDEAGDVAGAVHQSRLAEGARFEAYLTQVAAVSGDTGLVTVDLRWDLATVALDVTADPDLDRLGVQRLLVEAVGPLEADALRSWLSAQDQPTP